jgi:hypothetical protein
MKQTFSDFIEAGRVGSGHLASRRGDSFGAFELRSPWGGRMIIICSGSATSNPCGAGWEHVSISFAERTPTWREMCWVKDQFWNEDETVIQFHPARSDYVNCYPFCLHLWRHQDGHQLPPSIFVGPQAKVRLSPQEQAQLERDIKPVGPPQPWRPRIPNDI